ncbi:MAG: DmsC/YnfH family molybdoenzyme membrane anchor subunit [Hydrogenophaga sp.]|jgi:DMSO reductase anchor subunit|nr:DmsC/YnfH family molybdoenzyme membrane anchor subunit [Hydrogenophaga sp.]OGB35450.1 MAG: DMSO reductase [Burkholderiales bacterium RIFCSPLOWO2_02_FULL_66_35]
MRPAFSVIFLTTLIGAAQGLFFALYGAELTLLSQTDAAASRQFLFLGSLVALVLTGLGLIASFFHLGRPERAWRSATMWRTSWLSREVIALPLFMLGLFVYGSAQYLGWRQTVPIGAVTALLSLALFVCTAMIYASVRFLQEWASPLTLLNYLLLGCASGLTLATLLAALLGMPDLVPPYALVAIGLTLLAAVSRGASLVRNARLKPRSSVQSAIGIKHPRIVQKAQGFMGGSFNTREFFHGQSATLLRSVKWIFLLLVFPLPLLCLALALSSSSTTWLLAAFALQYVGLLAERWYFFAQANHPQNLYYQTIS